MNIISVPKWISVVAFVVGLIASTFGSGTVAWLLGKGKLDSVDAAFAVFVLAGTSSLAHIFVMSTLNLMSLPTTGAQVVPELPVPTPADPTEVYNPATDGSLVSGNRSEADEPPAITDEQAQATLASMPISDTPAVG